MKFLDFWKDLISLLSTKGRRKLRELEKIQDKTFRIQTEMQESRDRMTEALVTATTEQEVACVHCSDLKAKLRKAENALVVVAPKTDPQSISDQNILNAEIQALEVEYEESQVQYNHLKGIVESISERRNSLEIEIQQADVILRTAAARYRTAETLLKANAGVLNADVFKAIEEIRQDSIRLQARNVAIATVADDDRKKDVKDVYARTNATTVSVEERVRMIQERNNKAE